MPTDVTMPQMGESIFEGTLTKWLKKPGDKVTRDEPLFEISTDKVDAEIAAPASGVLQDIKVQEGATVQVNTVVATIAEEGAAAVSASAPAAQAPAQAQASQAPAQPQAPASSNQAPVVASPSPTPTPAPAAPAADAGPGTPVTMPQMGESIFEGTLTKWLKKVGDQVTRDEPLFEISTDTVDAEIPAPATGVLTEIKVQEGTTVQVNSVVATIGSAGAGAPAAPAPQAAAPQAVAPAAPAAPAQTQAAAQPATQAQAGSGERVRSSPLVRKIA